MEEHDKVFRFGGDEFVFCLSNVTDVSEVERKIEKIRSVLASPIIIDGRVMTVGCSIGVAIYPDNSDSTETLISMADTALYRIKATKKGSVLFYNNSLRDEINYALSIEQELSQALSTDEIYVQYQPQVSTQDGRIKGVEALARWRNQKLGFVPPDKFIAVAEDTGAIHEIGLFIFKKACQDIVELSQKYNEELPLSVNVSPIQLMEPEFSNQLWDICKEIGIDPSVVTLEITENIFIHDIEVSVMPVLLKLRNLGFGLSLDDFGTGYSSLRYVNNLPLTEIKIDRSFTSSFLTSAQSDMLIKMIIGIGHSCGLTVVAEGVETLEQKNQLAVYDCNLVQGYYFYKPLLLDELDRCIHHDREGTTPL